MLWTLYNDGTMCCIHVPEFKLVHPQHPMRLLSHPLQLVIGVEERGELPQSCPPELRRLVDQLSVMCTQYGRKRSPCGGDDGSGSKHRNWYTSLPSPLVSKLQLPDEKKEQFYSKQSRFIGLYSSVTTHSSSQVMF